MDRFGYQQDGGAPHPRCPRLWSARSRPFCKEPLSAEGSGVSVTGSFVTAQLAPKSPPPQRHAVKTPVPIAPRRISQPVSPCATAPAWGTRWPPGTFGGAERSCHLALVRGEMEQVEQESVSVGKLQVDGLQACNLLKWCMGGAGGVKSKPPRSSLATRLLLGCSR